MNTDSVRLVSNGQYWKATWRDSSGKRQEKSLGSKKKLTKGGAVHLCRDIAREHAISPGRKDVRISPTLGQWRAIFIKQHESLHENTLALYKQTFDTLVDELGEHTRIDKVTRANAASWRSKVAQRTNSAGEQISDNTVAKHTGNAKAIFGEAARQDMVAFNPFDRLDSSRPETEKDWHNFDEREMELIFKHSPDICFRAGVALCRYAGLRPNEMLRVRPGDIDWNEKVLTVQPAKRKPSSRGAQTTTKQKKRIVPIEPRLYVILREAFEAMPAGTARFWNRSNDNLRRDLLVVLANAGLPAVAEPWKTMRKNCETDWQSRNPPLPPLDVAAWLGHDITVSAKHYHRTKGESIARITEEAQDIDSLIARAEAHVAELKARRENPAKIGLDSK